ncbi:MAG: type II toxin-antitoxin system HicA family toxin, partial [Candidatus Rokuibacteriota bacterium]
MFSIVARQASAVPPTGCSSRDEAYWTGHEESRLCSLRELEDGWRQARTRGHRQYKNPNKPGTVTVAGKPSLEVPPGTQNAILRQAGLKKAGSG